MGLTKAQLEALNDSSFPNNNAGYITPTILRDYNDAVILNTVNQDAYILDSASVDLRLDNLENFSSSLVTNFATVAYVNGVSASLTSTASFNQYTASTAATIAGLATTASVNAITQSVNNISTSVGLLQTFSGSQYKADSASFSSRIIAAENTGYVTTASFNAYTSSTNNTIAGLTTTASFNSYTSSTDTKINSLNTISASYLSFTQSYYSDSASFDGRLDVTATTGSNTFNGNQIINGNVSASSFVSASKFVGDGSQLTGVTASVSIAILDEGVYKGNATALNFTGSGLTASVVAGIALIQAEVDLATLTQYTTTASFNAYTQSTNTFTASISTSVGLLQTFSGSQYKADSASFSTRIDNSQPIGFVTTASFNAYTSSNDTKVNNLTNATASYALSSSVAAVDIAQDGRIASLTALTASTAYTNVNNTFSGTQSFDNVIVTGTASVAFLNVTYQSSSVIYSSGSNILGDEANVDTQTLVGRVIITGSLEVTGSSRFNGNIFITGSGSINGSPIVVSSQTSSMAVSSSLYAVTASYALFAQTASEARNVVVVARNGNQSTLSAGTVVRITSAVGDNPIFNTSSFTSETLSSNTLGILRTSIASGVDGEVVVNGIVLGVNTDPTLGYAAGDVIYLSASGQFTRTQPQAPNQTVTLGEVLRAQQNNGSIYVNISNGWELNELHNVQINTPLTNDILAYESSSYGLWKNKSISALGLATTSSVNDLSASLYFTDTTQSANINTLIAQTASYATTGSNSFVGDQTITGSVTISGSSTTDLTIVGQIFVSSSATGTTTRPQITVSGSAGQSIINRNSISTRNTTNLAQLSPAAVFMNVTATSDEIGFSVDTSATPNWSTGASLYINNPTDTYPAVFGFQNKANYTDGRVTILSPLSASAGIVGDTSITGSLILSSSNAVELNVIGNALITGSLVMSSSAAVELQVIGGVEITGSVAGNITALSVASSTASIDFNLGTFFTLTIPSSSVTYITGSNLKPGMTANIVLTQQSTTGSVRFETTLFKFPSGSINTGSAVASAVDIVSVMSVNTTTLLSVGANRLI
jgi:hypothetical protein